MRTGRNADEFQLTSVANPPFLYLWLDSISLQSSRARLQYIMDEDELERCAFLITAHTSDIDRLLVYAVGLLYIL